MNKTIKKAGIICLIITVLSGCAGNTAQQTANSYQPQTTETPAADVTATEEPTSPVEIPVVETAMPTENPIVETPTPTEPVHEPVPEGEKAGFVLLTDVVPEAIVEIRYYTTYNFVGERIDGYEQPVALATREAAEALKKVNDELMTKGYRIKIFDIYRPVSAVEHFVRWSKDVGDTRMKEYFYPELDKSVLFKKGYISKKSGHSRGSTVDLTLFDMRTGKEVDMGVPFDFFGEISHPSSTEVTDEHYSNRMILKNAMEKHGFKSMSTEWWHFTLKDEPYPGTYFNFPVNINSVKKP